MKKISTSLLTTIIAVGVAVALVVAMFVPTIITLTKNNKEVDALDAQIAELKEQLEALKGADTLTDEDVATAISDALAKLEIPEAGLTEAQVKAIVDAAIGALVIPDAGLSEAQVKAIVDAAIAALVIPEAGLSKEEVEKIVADAIKGVDTGLTEAEINKLIADAIAKIEIPEAGLTAEEVNKLIADAIAKIEIPEAGLTAEEVNKLIADAIAKIEIPEAGLSEEQVKAIVDAAIGALVIPEAGLTQAEIEKIVADAIAGIDTGLTEAEINKLIADAIAKIEIPEAGLTADEINKLIADAIAKIEIPEAGLTAEEVNKLIADAIAQIEIPEAGLSEAQVKAIVDAAIAALDIPAPGLTEAEVEEIVKALLAELFPEVTLEESLASGSNFKLEEDTTLSKGVTVPAGTAMILDLNGKNLTLPNLASINVAGNLYIVDTVGNGTINKYYVDPIFSEISGTLTINGIAINDCDDALNALIANDNVTLVDCTYNDALALAKNGSTVEIELIDNFSFGQYHNLTVPAGTSVTLDLAGLELGLSTDGLCVAGELVISGEGVIDAFANGPFSIEEGGALTITDAEIIAYEALLGYFFSTAADVTLDNCTLEYDTGSIQKIAISRINGRTDITCLSNTTFLADYVVPADNEVTIDLNGKSFTLGVTASFTVNGSLSFENGNDLWVRSSDAHGFTVNTDAELNIVNVTIQCETTDGYNVIYNNGSVVIDGATLEVYTSIPGITVTKIVIDSTNGDCLIIDSTFVEMENKDDTTPVEIEPNDYVEGNVKVWATIT